jgi:hypothetical protein
MGIIKRSVWLSLPTQYIHTMIGPAAPLRANIGQIIQTGAVRCQG